MDQEPAIRAREGDHDAFNQLVAGTIGGLTAVARLILRDEDRAQDAVEDAYLPRSGARGGHGQSSLGACPGSPGVETQAGVWTA